MRLPPVELTDGAKHRLQVHSGIHAGFVLVSEGSIEVGRVQLLGDGPNTAAKLATMAKAGQILVDAETLGPALSFFVHGPEIVAMLPGRRTPARVLEITARSGLRARLDSSLQRGLSPLHGRTQTIHEVAQALDSSLRAARQLVVLVQGESGIGKSRFLFELAETLKLKGDWCLHGRCDSDPQAPVLLPFLEVVEQIGSRAPSPPGATATDLSEGRSAVLSALTWAAPRHPVLMLDDWQWADDASRQMLSEVMALHPTIRVVLASRSVVDRQGAIHLGSGREGFGAALEVRLAPLALEETLSVVSRLAPGTDPFVAADIHRYAGGVPLFVEELCHALRGLGVYGLRSLSSDSRRTGTPGWMAALVSSRLVRLTGAQRRIMDAAAVLGTSFPLDLLEGTMGMPLKASELDALAGADMLFASDRNVIAFKHGLTRDAIYELIPHRARQALHASAVAALVSQRANQPAVDVTEALALHCTAAGAWQEATRHCEAAGDKAMQLFAFDRARAHFLTAITTADRVASEESTPDSEARWCRLVHKLGMTCIFDPLALPDALPIFERGLDRARRTGDLSIIARSAYWLGYLSYGFGQPRRAVVQLEQALGYARQCGDVRLVAQVEATLGQALAARGCYDPALRLMEAGLTAKKQSARSGSAPAVGSAFTLACQASIWGDQGNFDRAHRALAEAHGLVGQSSHPVANSIRNWQMVILAWQGLWDDALAVVDQSITIAERTQALLPLAIARAVGGHARWMRDGDEAGLEQLRQAVLWFEQRSSSFYTSIYYGWLVSSSVAVNRLDDARSYAGRLACRARAGEQLGLAAGWRALSLAAMRDDPTRAARYLSRADAAARRRGSHRDLALNELRRAALMSATGQPELATRLRANAIEQLIEMNMRGFAAADPLGPL